MVCPSGCLAWWLLRSCDSASRVSMRYGSAAAMVLSSSLDRRFHLKQSPISRVLVWAKVPANPEIRVVASAVMAFGERKYAEVRGVDVARVESVE